MPLLANFLTLGIEDLMAIKSIIGIKDLVTVIKDLSEVEDIGSEI